MHYGSAGEGTKALFHKGFPSLYALVTTFYTYPEPTPGNMTKVMYRNNR